MRFFVDVAILLSITFVVTLVLFFGLGERAYWIVFGIVWPLFAFLVIRSAYTNTVSTLRLEGDSMIINNLGSTVKFQVADMERIDVAFDMGFHITSQIVFRNPDSGKSTTIPILTGRRQIGAHLEVIKKICDINGTTLPLVWKRHLKDID